MARAARQFPREVERFLRDFKQWDGLSEVARRTLTGLGVKLEPFGVPQAIAPQQNDLRGFECLAYGADGASYAKLADLAHDQKISKGLLGITLFRVALLTAQALVDEIGSAVPGSVWSRLFISINVDAEMLRSSVFAGLLDQIPKPPYQVFLEASENLQPEHVGDLRRVLDRHESWLKLALDDSDELAHDTRELLSPRVALVKADGRYVRKLYRDRDKTPNYMLSRLLELRLPGKPFVAEGVEHEDLKRYLKDRWDVSAHGELWMQGYHISVPAPWADVLEAIHDDPLEPRGFVLPQTLMLRPELNFDSKQHDRIRETPKPEHRPLNVKDESKPHSIRPNPFLENINSTRCTIVDGTEAGPAHRSFIHKELFMAQRIVALTDAWGTRFGGINAFNTGLMKALGTSQGRQFEIVCAVHDIDSAEREDVWTQYSIRVVATGLSTEDVSDTALEKWRTLVGSTGDSPDAFQGTVWLGHDDKSGPLAIALRNRFGGKAILIHHMAHGAYQAFKKGNSVAAHEKENMQRELFSEADLCFAVGPRLRNELEHLLSTVHGAPAVGMLIPGLESPEDYKVKSLDKPSMYFGGFAAGRLTRNDDRIKQGRLAVRAISTVIAEARKTGLIPRLTNAPRMCMMGAEPGQEAELRQSMQTWADAQLQIKILPFSEDRTAYYRELSGASFAMMLSWHEGFGLTGWEAISARVPLILGKNSGLWEFLRDEMNGTGLDQCIFPLDIAGNLPSQEGDENHSEADVSNVAMAIQKLAINAEQAKAKAIRLHDAILEAGWTWARAAKEFVERMNGLPGGGVYPPEVPEPPASAYAPVLDWILAEAACELVKKTCQSIAITLLAMNPPGKATDVVQLRQGLEAWIEQMPDAVKRIEVLERAVRQAFEPLSPTEHERTALLRHGERLLGLMALSAVKPQALPKGEDLGEELFKLGIGTVVGVELIQAAQSRRTEVVFVWVGKDRKQIRSSRMLSVNSLENGWDVQASANEAIKEIVKCKVELAGDQAPTQDQIDEAVYLLTRDGHYFAVSPSLTPNHALLDKEARTVIHARFPDQPIYLFDPAQGHAAHEVFSVSEGRLTGAIRKYLEMLDEFRKA